MTGLYYIVRLFNEQNMFLNCLTEIINPLENYYSDFLYIKKICVIRLAIYFTPKKKMIKYDTLWKKKSVQVIFTDLWILKERCHPPVNIWFSRLRDYCCDPLESRVSAYSLPPNKALRTTTFLLFLNFHMYVFAGS